LRIKIKFCKLNKKMGKISPRKRHGILDWTNHVLVKGGVGDICEVDHSRAVKIHYESKDGLEMMKMGRVESTRGREKEQESMCKMECGSEDEDKGRIER